MPENESIPVNEEDFIRTRTVAPEMQKPWWRSRKLGYILLSILTMILGEKVGGASFTADHYTAFALGVAGIGVGGHAFSDFVHKRKQTELPPSE